MTFKPKAQNNSRKDSIVLLFDTHIAFPKAEAHHEVPAGVYYPAILHDTEEFILTKFSPRSHGDLDMELTEMLVELSSELTGIDPEEAYSKASEGRSDYVERGYFRMEEYHTGLMKIEKNFESFLNSKEFYKEHNLGYKRSALLYGAPGTGKSRYIENLSLRLIHQQNAIVIRIESSHDLAVLLQKGIYYINNKMQDRLKVIIIEELATLVMRDNHTELLNLLDHTHLRDDIIFLMTTNNPERIPENIVDRPSRVDILEEIGVEGYTDEFIEAWYEHLMNEPMPSEWKHLQFYKNNLSPAYLKELFISMKVNKMKIEESWNEIERRRKKIRSRFKQETEIGF